MASLSLKHIYKVYDGGVKAVNDFCMDIKDKEFIVFVGPSGCGKSTTLRMIAGLEEITAGELMIGDEVVNDTEPKDRNIAMVFQNYALYPHMSVRENMAFALRLSKQFTEAEINDKVNEAAEILDITQFLERKPRALSGGQRQRVSLGRAIVRQPKVFLLDEPLSNLDAKLRAQMRTEITKLHKKLATTFIYVTHDQVEAMTMGTRIVVMKLGIVQQIDTPQNLYRYPGNKFVAGFIGTPQMNFYNATLLQTNDGRVKVTFANDRVIYLPAESVIKAAPEYFDGLHTVTLGVRPEDIHYDEEYVKSHADTSFVVKTSIIEALGSESIVYCELDDSNSHSIAESDTRLVLKIDPKTTLEAEKEIKVAIDPERIHLFDADTEKTIMPRIPEENVLDCTVENGTLNALGESIALPPAITIANGKYSLHIPSDAFIFAGNSQPCTYSQAQLEYSVNPSVQDKKQEFPVVVQNISPINFAKNDYIMSNTLRANIKEKETINNTLLTRLEINGNTLFAVGEVSTAEQKVQFVFDWKKLYFTTIDVNTEAQTKQTITVFPALQSTNVLPCKLIKERVAGPLKNDYNFALEIDGKAVMVTEYIKSKLFNAAGRKVFSVSLSADFDIYNALLLKQVVEPSANEGIPNVMQRNCLAGIPVTVSKVFDFAVEKIIQCTLNDINVYVAMRLDMPQVTVGETVYLSINLPAIGVVEKDRGIRII